ncbi:MAG: hypothetical protein H6604_06050 [Flavobacteriales bacterium]|nr:hypothetical protein [Flavobacteriales bacterium]
MKHKKISPSLLGFLIAVILSVGSMAVYFVFLQKDEFYLLDNPTSKPTVVELNDVKYHLQPYEQKKVDLNKGRNSIKIYDDKNKIIRDTFFNVETKRGVINPTFNKYYIFTQYYGHVENKDSLMLSESMNIDNKNYFGKIEADSTLFISDFYFNLNEDFQKVIKNIDSLERRKKIFRKKDFIDYYTNNYR